MAELKDVFNATYAFCGCVYDDRKERATAHGATLAFKTSGAVYRRNDVPIPLRQTFDSPHSSDHEVLARTERRLRELQGVPVEPRRAE